MTFFQPPSGFARLSRARARGRCWNRACSGLRGVQARQTVSGEPLATVCEFDTKRAFFWSGWLHASVQAPARANGFELEKGAVGRTKWFFPFWSRPSESQLLGMVRNTRCRDGRVISPNEPDWSHFFPWRDPRCVSIVNVGSKNPASSAAIARIAYGEVNLKQSERPDEACLRSAVFVTLQSNKPPPNKPPPNKHPNNN